MRNSSQNECELKRTTDRLRRTADELAEEFILDSNASDKVKL